METLALYINRLSQDHLKQATVDDIGVVKFLTNPKAVLCACCAATMAIVIGSEEKVLDKKRITEVEITENLIHAFTLLELVMEKAHVKSAERKQAKSLAMSRLREQENDEKEILLVYQKAQVDAKRGLSSSRPLRWLQESALSAQR